MSDEPINDATGQTAQLAYFAASCTFEQLPTELLELLNTLLLDNLATLLSGAVQPVHADVVKAMMVATGSGSVEAVGGAKVCLSTAVLLDGISAADFEFEHVNPNSHPASSVFPAIFTLAAERHASGHQLLTAMAVAYEVATRIGNANTSAAEKRGFHNPGITGAPAAAAGCCNLLGLDATTTASAMGLAASSSAGLLAFVTTGAMTKRLHPGRGAQLGLEAALMAQAGVQGPRDVFENSAGYLTAFSPAPDASQLTVDLGTVWKTEMMILKLAPVHALAQYAIYAINQFRDAGNEIAAEQVDKVVIKTGPTVMNPSQMDRTPNSLVAAQFSVPFGIALSLARDLRNPMVVDDSSLTDSNVLEIARKITFEKITDDPKQLGGTVVLTLAGKEVDLQANTYPGFPGSAGYAEAINQRFSRVLRGLGKEQHEQPILNAVSAITNSKDVAILRQTLLTAAR